MRPRKIAPEQRPGRDALRVIGPAVLILGLALTAVGFISFFTAFGGFGSPRFFWCAFIGIPLLGVGGMLCRVAFLGPITRYVADEVAPVGRDVVNYMAEGTRDSVRDLAAAVGEGLRSGPTAAAATGARCDRCGTENDGDAKFCKSCGAVLSSPLVCSDCAHENDADARFCDHCGRPLR